MADNYKNPFKEWTLDFSPEEQEHIEKIKDNDQYVRYLCNLWYREGSLENLSGRLGVSEDFFYKLFSFYPQIEDLFDSTLREVSEKVSKRINSMSLPVGLEKVGDIIGSNVDERITIQAVSLQLQYYLKSKEKSNGGKDDEDELDKIFAQIEKEQKE